MLYNLIRGMFSGQNITFVDLLVGLFSAFFVIFVTMPVHEWAHAFTACKLGDPTAKYHGRLTLNPMAHIHWLGAVLVLLFGFGFAKPVPVNQRNFKHPKWGMALTALAGPLSNFIVGFFSFLIMVSISVAADRIVGVDQNVTLVYVLGYVSIFFYYAGYINLCLASFNLIPIPPLDGSRILFAVLPDRIYYRIQAYERYIYLIVVFLAAFGMLSGPTQWIANQLSSFCYWIISSLFNLFL